MTKALLNPTVKRWSEDADTRLCDAIADGLTFRQASLLLNKTRDACIGRFHRITAAMEGMR